VISRLRIADFQLNTASAWVGHDTDLLLFGRGFNQSEHMLVLGMSALERLSYFTIDNLRGTVTFAPQASFEPDRSLNVVAKLPLRWKHSQPETDIVISGRTFPCMVDTGGDLELVVGESRLEELKRINSDDLDPMQGLLDDSAFEGEGLGGKARTGGYYVKHVALGDARFEKVKTLIESSEPGTQDQRVLVGNMFLRRYRVTFDLRNDTLWLEH
jgi:predicted aspartyl protease